MADKPLDASPAAPALRPRREVFDYGLLPIPKLVLPEGTLTQTLSQMKESLALGGPHVGAAALAEVLHIPADQAALALAEALQILADQAALALGTLAAVLPAEDPALGGDGAGEADLRDLLLFLYIQSYKRVVPRADSPAVADVWPSTSAFDGYLSLLSPIQVLTMETFEHLGFLLQFPEGTPLSQVASFFANSDPDMPAASVPAAVRKSDEVLFYLNGRCIYLVGMMGSGKSTVGKIMAEVLGYSFFDRFVVIKAKQQLAKSLHKIESFIEATAANPATDSQADSQIQRMHTL